MARAGAERMNWAKSDHAASDMDTADAPSVRPGSTAPRPSSMR